MSAPLAARFRAIVAGPLSANTDASDQNVYETYGGFRFQGGPNAKRKRDAGEGGPSTLAKPTSEEGRSTRGVCSLDAQIFGSDNLPYLISDALL